jgi:hypothetical protein
MQATVEVLTAQVRTLMVGSRQVTLSVYKQLDRVQPHEITPFGRVNVGSVGDIVETVGMDHGGALVASRLHRVSTRYCTPDLGELIVAQGMDKKWLTNLQIVVDGVARRVSGKDAAFTWASPQKWDFRDVDAQDYAEAVVRTEVAAATAQAVRWREWTQMPLIVLAGLR